MSFLEVEHQPRAHRVIQRALSCARLPHAYVFAGPEGVGKEMLARRVAQYLLCESPQRIHPPHAAGLNMGDAFDACGTCQDCRLFAAGTHPDYSLIHRQMNRVSREAQIRKQKSLTISVDVVREFLIEKVGTYPVRGRARVFVIREAERLNDSSQNALLKTLEEPPEHTFLILLTSSLERMLPTTRSRCQQVLFQPLPPEFIERKLVELRPDAPGEENCYLALHAQGSLGGAMLAAEDGAYALKRTWGEQLVKLAAGDPRFAPTSLAKPLEADARTLGARVAERDPDVSDTDATRSGLNVLLAVIADFYQDALRLVCGANVPPVNADQRAVVETLARSHDAEGLQRMLRVISACEYHIGRNASIELALETLFIGLSRAGALATT